jgi:hypothetical protein
MHQFDFPICNSIFTTSKYTKRKREQLLRLRYLGIGKHLRT